MRPATIHKIAKDIRQLRGMLGNRDKWFMDQEPSMVRTEAFREIKFWHWVYTKAEAALASGEYRVESADWHYVEQPDESASVVRR